MGKVKVQDATLFMLLKNFFLVYLPCMRNASKHTIRSYQETWSQFLAYLAEQNHVSLSAVRFDMIHFTSVNHYMSYLASEKDVWEIAPWFCCMGRAVKSGRFRLWLRRFSISKTM